MRRFLPVVLLLATAAHAQSTPGGESRTANRESRPSITLTTKDSFDATKIPPYKGTHPAVYAYIDAHQPQHVAALQRWLRQPSISAQNVGIAEMAAMVRDDLKSL